MKGLVNTGSFIFLGGKNMKLTGINTRRSNVTLETYIDSALVAARQLFYPEDILDRIINAKTKAEVDVALAEGRHCIKD